MEFEILVIWNYLFARVRGEVEGEDGEEGDAHAGDDDVDGVEKGFPPHRDVEGDVEVGLVAARVEPLVPENSHTPSPFGQELINKESNAII